MENRTAAGDKQIEVIANGSCGVVALHAAALDERIRSLTVKESLISWGEVARSAMTTEQFANIVPGVLRHDDLPDVA